MICNASLPRAESQAPQPCTRKRGMPLVPEKGTVWEKLRRWGSGSEEKLLFTRKGRGSGKPKGSQRGQERALLNLGGESQRSLHLPEMWALHPRRKGYQGGKWGTRKLSPPTSKKEEEACNIQRRVKHSLFWHRTGKGQGLGPLPLSVRPGEQSAWGSVSISWGRTNCP